MHAPAPADLLKAPKHPARYTPALLPIFERLLAGYDKVLDPFAGTGERLLSIRPDAYLVELEPEWAAVSQAKTDRSIVGNALLLHEIFPEGFFDAVCTSPAYGNRFADHHNAKDASRRRSYTHDLGRSLHTDNAGKLHYGPSYQDLHRRVWRNVRHVLRPGARFVLNVKDFVRKGAVVPVTDWHIGTILEIGFTMVEHCKVDAPGLRHGQNRAARVDYESVIAFERI